MTTSFYLATISAITHLALAIIVLLKNHKKLENRLFSVLLLLFMFWCSSEAFMSYNGVKPSPFQLKAMLTAVISLTYGFYLFSAYFPTKQPEAYILKTPKAPYLFFIPAAILLIMVWTDNVYIVSDWMQNGFMFKYAKTEFITKGIIISYLILSLFTLNKSFKEADNPIMARRLRYTFMAMLLPVAMGPIIIAISKYLFDNGTMYIYGVFPILGIIMGIMLTYTMLKYNLMDIDLIFSIGLLYTLTSVVIAGCMELVQELLQDVFNTNDTLGKAITILLIAAVFSPVKAGIEKLINLFFGRKDFDSAQVMQKTLDKLRSQPDIESLVSCFKSELSYITDAKKIEFIKAGESPEKHLALLPSNTSDIDEIIFKYNSVSDSENEAKALELKNGDVKLYYSFNVSNKAYGSLLISTKKTNVPYTENEISLINGLNNEFPHIIENIETIQKMIKQQKAAQETQIAANMLNDISTKPGTTEIGDFEVASFTSLAADIKGDMLDICKDPVNTYVSLYDAFHNGIKAVLTLNIVYTVFRSVTTMVAKIKRSSEILSTFAGQNLSYAFTTIQTQDKKITITNFGNPIPIIVSQGTSRRVGIAVKKPVGLETDLEKNSVTIELNENEYLLCFTNGLEKIFKAASKISIDEFIQNQAFSSATDCRNKITDAIYSKITEGFSDDTTFIVVGLKCKEEEAKKSNSET